jgi:hypothetical protein
MDKCEAKDKGDGAGTDGVVPTSLGSVSRRMVAPGAHGPQLGSLLTNVDYHGRSLSRLSVAAPPADGVGRSELSLRVLSSCVESGIWLRDWFLENKETTPLVQSTGLPSPSCPPDMRTDNRPPNTTWYMCLAPGEGRHRKYRYEANRTVQLSIPASLIAILGRGHGSLTWISEGMSIRPCNGKYRVMDRPITVRTHHTVGTD